MRDKVFVFKIGGFTWRISGLFLSGIFCWRTCMSWALKI